MPLSPLDMRDRGEGVPPRDLPIRENSAPREPDATDLLSSELTSDLRKELAHIRRRCPGTGDSRHPQHFQAEPLQALVLIERRRLIRLL